MWRALAAKHRDGAIDPWAEALTGGAGTVLVGDWRFVGSGFAHHADRLIAEQRARNDMTAREIEREEQAEEAEWRRLVVEHDAQRVRVVDPVEWAEVA